MTKKQSITGAEDTRRSADTGFFCYIGPALPGLIEHGAVLPAPREAALKAAERAIEKYPSVKMLIVSSEDLPELRLRAKTPGTALYNICRRLPGRK